MKHRFGPFLALAACVSLAGLAGCDAQPGPAQDNAVSAGARDDNAPAASKTSPGKIAFIQCSACHALDPEGAAKLGPHLADIVGRKAGAVEGFAYSDPMRNSGLTWTREELDRFLTQPAKAMPGTKMIFVGIADATKRAKLIDYLESAGTDAAP